MKSFVPCKLSGLVIGRCWIASYFFFQNQLSPQVPDVPVHPALILHSTRIPSFFCVSEVWARQSRGMKEFLRRVAIEEVR